jgi:hypothetical protein
MAKSKHKRTPKAVLKLPDLEQSKSAVINSLTSASSKRSYDHAIREFIDWYCSEPRLAFAILAASHAAASMVVQLEADGFEPRFWITSRCRRFTRNSRPRFHRAR